MLPITLNKMVLKKFLLIIFILDSCYSAAQKIIFKDNFENKKLDSASWKNVTGNWLIGDVQNLRIAPAENGYRYALLAGDQVGDNNISLFVNLPDSLRAKKIKLSFSYYILANLKGTKIEVEFYQKEMKDRLRPISWVYFLYRAKGRWSVFQKTLTIPAGANQARIIFYGFQSSGMKDRIVCYDNVVISTLK